MSWYESRGGRKVYAADGSGLAEVYATRYKLLGADDDVAVEFTTDPPRLDSAAAAALAQAVDDETPPEVRPLSRMRRQELAQAAADAGLDTAGTVPELRARLEQHNQRITDDE